MGHKCIRTHGTVEDVRKRLDSYHHRELQDLANTDGFVKCGAWTIYSDRIENEEGAIPLITVQNNYGGYRLYYECPFCYQRCRYLYWFDNYWYACRRCAMLNYRSQQETRSNGNHAALQVEKLLHKLGAGQMHALDSYTPDKPLNLHWNTYRKLIQKLYIAQNKYDKHTVKLLAKYFS